MKVLRLKSGTVCSLLLVGTALACGGKSAEQSPTGGDGGDSSGDGDGDESDGGSGGVASGDGGSPTGGVPSDGGSAPASGGGGTGGSDDVTTVATLGEPCEIPGAFACAEANPKLALICGGDGEWEDRETCAGDAVCDPNAGGNLGTCRVPIAECALADAVFCDGSNQVVTCVQGGLETTVIEECLSGYGCADGACVLVDDPCHEEQTYNCSSDCGEGSTGCYGAEPQDDCGNAYWSGALHASGVTIVRIPDEDLCRQCERQRYELAWSPESFPTMATKVTIGPGWGLIANDENGDIDGCSDTAIRCVMVPPTNPSNDRRVVLAVALSDDPPVRNVTIEVVDPGTRCD